MSITAARLPSTETMTAEGEHRPARRAEEPLAHPGRERARSARLGDGDEAQEDRAGQDVDHGHDGDAEDEGPRQRALRGRAPRPPCAPPPTSRRTRRRRRRSLRPARAAARAALRSARRTAARGPGLGLTGGEAPDHDHGQQRELQGGDDHQRARGEPRAQGGDGGEQQDRHDRDGLLAARRPGARGRRRTPRGRRRGPR